MKVAVINTLNKALEKRGIDYYVDRLLSESLLKSKCEINFEDFSPFRKYEEYDVVHVPFFEPYKFSIPTMSKAKVVVTIHDVTRLAFPQEFPTGPSGKIEFLKQKLFLYKIDRVITDSQFSKKEIAKYLPIKEDRVSVTYLAADKEYRKLSDPNFLKSIRKKYRLPEKFVLCVSEANWNKNILSLCHACDNLKIPLVLVGKVWLKDDFEADNIETIPLEMIMRFIKNKQNVIRTGFVPTKDLVAINNLASLYVQPSIYEGFGLPLLEAMTCGTPVVCTRRSSFPEIVNEAGIYAEDTDSVSIADAISKFFKLDSSKQKSFGQLALKQSSKFAWEKTAKQTLEIYEKVTERK